MKPRLAIPQPTSQQSHAATVEAIPLRKVPDPAMGGINGDATNNPYSRAKIEIDADEGNVGVTTTPRTESCQLDDESTTRNIDTGIIR